MILEIIVGLVFFVTPIIILNHFKDWIKPKVRGNKNETK